MEYGGSQYWAPTMPTSSRGLGTVEDAMRESLSATLGMPPEQRRLYMHLFTKYLAQRREPTINWEAIEEPPSTIFRKHNDLPECPEDVSLRYGLLDKIAILKLNGSVGSEMGCSRAISSVEIRPDLTFLDLIVKQVEYLNNKYGVDIPLILMNSFRTEEITDMVIRKYANHNLTIHTFTQSTFPKINKHTLTPIPDVAFLANDDMHSNDPHEAFPQQQSKEYDSWYSPGHGDVYDMLHQSGLLETLLNQGKEYIFISNIDNVGATISPLYTPRAPCDLRLLYHIVENDLDFVMCTTKRNKSDLQTGFLAGYALPQKDPNSPKVVVPRLIESKMVPKHLRKSVCGKAQQVNTNNLWMNLLSLQRQIARGPLALDLIVSEHTYKEVETAIQLETAAGSAISCFSKVIAVQCPRAFFFPVKTPSDMFLVQSNVYNIRHGMLDMSEKRNFSKPPLVKLGKYYSTLEDYERRLAHGIPDLLELEHLTVAGDVYFGRDVTLKGTVILVANEGSVIMIPDGSVLEDKVITGNLSILDH